MASRLHFHTDCAFFAGCESMLVNFCSSSEVRRQFAVSLSYRDSERYRDGLHRRIRVDFPLFSLRTPGFNGPDMLPDSWPAMVKRPVVLALRLVLTLPVLTYELWFLASLFRRLRPHIVHINNGGYPGGSGETAAIAAHLAGVPRIVMVVNSMAEGYSRPSRWFSYPLDRWVAHAVSVFVTGSTEASQRLKSVLRLPDGKCAAIPNGIDLRQTSETPTETRARLGLATFDGVVFGVVAVLRDNKGHFVLLEALSRLAAAERDRQPSLKVLIEGDGPLREALQAFVVAHQLEPYCSFSGVERNVMDFLAALDVVILPSTYGEDFPNVVLEAMGMGKAVIASRLAGTSEQIVEGETGVLVEPGDPDQLAAAIQTLARDRPLREAMGRAGRCRFQDRFTAEQAVSRYLSLYQPSIGSQQR